MSNPNLPPSPVQVNINRDGGLYDQALAEDATRTAAQKDEQDFAYATYDDNIHATQKREQDEAYGTYSDNLQATKDREQSELEGLQKKMRIAKIKHGFGRIAAATMFIPGVGYIADTITEEVTSMKLNSARRKQYKSQNGTLFGNQKKGYASTINKNYKKYTQRYSGNTEPIIKDLKTLIAERERSLRKFD